MKLRQSIILIVSVFMLVLFNFGCVTSTLQIETTPPGADVFVTIDKQPPKKVGQSPMALGATDLSVLSDSFVVTLKKPGFKSESVFVSSKSLPYQGYIGANLHEDSLLSGGSSGGTTLEASLEEVARGVAQVLNLIRNKEYDQGLSVLSNLKSRYSTVSTFYGLEGNIYYLQKSIDKALLAYQKANQLSASTETQRMINKLEELRGGRSPSSREGRD